MVRTSISQAQVHYFIADVVFTRKLYLQHLNTIVSKKIVINGVDTHNLQYLHNPSRVNCWCSMGWPVGITSYRYEIFCRVEQFSFAGTWDPFLFYNNFFERSKPYSNCVPLYIGKVKQITIYRYTDTWHGAHALHNICNFVLSTSVVNGTPVTKFQLSRIYQYIVVGRRCFLFKTCSDIRVNIPLICITNAVQYLQISNRVLLFLSRPQRSNKEIVTQKGRLLQVRITFIRLVPICQIQVKINNNLK